VGSRKRAVLMAAENGVEDDVHDHIN
jgi:hypothetical protein